MCVVGTVIKNTAMNILEYVSWLICARTSLGYICTGNDFCVVVCVLYLEYLEQKKKCNCNLKWLKQYEYLLFFMIRYPGIRKIQCCLFQCLNNIIWDLGNSHLLFCHPQCPFHSVSRVGPLWSQDSYDRSRRWMPP